MSRSAHFGGATSLAGLCFAILLIGKSTSAERWSRQLTGEGNNGDWIPLPADGRPPPQQQQAQARVLIEPQFTNNFFPQETFHDYLAQGGARQLFVQPPNSVSQQSFLPKSQSQPIRLTLSSQFNALPQSFSFPRVNQMPYNDFRQSIQAQFHQPHLVAPPVQFNNQFYNQPPKGIVLAPVNSQPPPPKQQIPQYNITSEISRPNLPTLKEYSVAPNVIQEKSSFGPTTQNPTTVEKEEVQLLYVPLETLQNKMFDVKQFLKNPARQSSFRDSIGSPGQINNQLYPSTTPAYVKQTHLNNIQQDLFQQQMNTQIFQEAFPKEHKFLHPSSSVTPSPFSQATHQIPLLSTPKTKKLKAHQPPLAIYMLQNGKEKARLGDVLAALKESNSVSVLDSIPLNAPKVFVGPNNLKTPSNIVKFELPYLSSIDGTRIPRRIESLPFFVAPLSYKAPNGFAKIPFPAPHIGSVIVNPYMKDAEESPKTIVNLSGQNIFGSFQQSSTEGFKSTLKEPIPTKPTNFNYFPSTTSAQNFPTFQSVKPSSITFSTIPEQYNTIYSTKNPEVNIINSSKAPVTFYPTSPRPTVTFFGFSEPAFNTHPTTTHKPSTSPVNNNRGHYITNPAVDSSRPAPQQNIQFKETISERPSTSPVPSFHVSKNPFNLITPVVLRNPYEPQNFIQNVRGNDGRHYNVVERPVLQNINQFPQTQQKYPQFQLPQKRPEIQTINFSPKNSFPSSAFPIEQSPTVPTIPKTTPQTIQYQQFNTFDNNKNQFNGFESNKNQFNTFESNKNQFNTFESNKNQFNTFESNKNQFNTFDNNRNQFNTVRNQEPEQYEEFGNKDVNGFVPLYNQFGEPNTEAEVTEINETFETETPAYEETTTLSTTTTTSTTTTPAPTTRSYTRRPVNRGRPRYTTTLKPDGEETTLRPTTRRTPLRERRPSTYRSRTTTTTDSSADGETTTKKPRDYVRSRYSNRQKTQDENITTTERNLRTRTRGRVNYKSTDNHDGSDLKKKKDGKESDLAYQRDVLHQNYPVTLSEKFSTLEVHTTTAIPSSTLSNNNIRIYETTGSTAKPLSVSTYETQTQEQPYYENEAIFQRETEKYLTHPDEYIEINGRSAGRTTPIQHPSTDEKIEKISTTAATTRYEEPEVTIEEEYFESKNINKMNQAAAKLEKQEENDKIETHGDGGLTYKYAPDVILTEAPIPKFRTKLKNRPKLLQSISYKHEEDNQNLSTDAFVTSTKKAVETTTEGFDFARKNSPSSYTHRPAFSGRRTTMKIEEIEEDLKSRRTQLRFDSRTSTNKYPIYIPESISTTASPINEENDVTTRRNKIIRRKPIVRSTTPSSKDSPKENITTEKPVNTKVRRVRVRTKVRKTTTERSESSANNDAVNEERYTTTAAPRVSAQRYSTKTRQRYFKRPVNLADKNEQSAENVDDQTYFDSINRPEIIKFNPVTGTHEYVEYNIENGKSETQWSPKSNPNAFRPIFNPNLIADGVKNDDYEYGSKLSFSEVHLDEPEIITARNSDDDGDYLITVTPPTNNVKPQSDRKRKEFVAEKPSTFETVLEEVMRNLEEQEGSQFMTVVKHEGGEIGEIPPESTVRTNTEKDTTESIRDVRPTVPALPTTMAEERFFSTAPDVQVSSTERRGRRRGGWRKVNVRPVQKDVLEGAESQFYKNSKNELLQEQKTQNKYEKTESKKVNDNVVIEKTTQETTTAVKDVVLQTEQNVPLKQETSQNKVEDQIDEQTEYPDLIAMEVLKDDVTFNPTKENRIQEATEPEISTEYLMSRTDPPIKDVTEEKIEIVTEIEEPTTTEQISVKETSRNQTENNVVTTTEVREELTEKTTEEVVSSKSFLEVMGELLGNAEEQITKSVETEVEVQDKDEKVKNTLETSTAGFKFLDPKAIISTSISTQISHETEICYRGKCIKTNKSESSKK